MRIRAIATSVAMLVGVQVQATPIYDQNLIDGLTPPPARIVLPMGLALRDLVPTAGGIAYLALDSYKLRADTEGLVYAAADMPETKTDAMPTAAVAQLQAERTARDMNYKFYGSLLVFAAGCMMWLGLSIRRNP